MFSSTATNRIDPRIREKDLKMRSMVTNLELLLGHIDSHLTEFRKVIDELKDSLDDERGDSDPDVRE